jgi:hypothetical protein
MNNEDFIFATHQAALDALREADAKWTKDSGFFIPKGEVHEAHEIDGCLELGSGGHFVVIDSTHGEYMVSKFGEWTCVA